MKNILLFTTLVLSSMYAVAETVLLDKIAAVVNKRIITETEVQQRSELLARGLVQEGRSVSSTEIRRDVLDSLINEELQMQQVRRNNITIDNITLNREIERIAQQQNLTVEQLYEKVIGSGLDYVEYREQIRRDIAIQQTFARIMRNRVKISEQEITDFLNSDVNPQTNRIEFNLSHIAIDIADNASDDDIKAADSKINQIYNDLIAGADFADSARDNSDSSTSLQGGELGWLKRQALPSRFMQVILEMGNNSVSKPFKTANAFNILKLHDIRGIEKQILNEVKARHILIKTSEIVDNEQALSKINSLRQRIHNGESFATIAKALSEDSVSAVAGGDLGWAAPTIYAREFQQVLNDLPVNTLSQAVKTQFGWHLIEVLDWRDTDITLERNRENAQIALLNRKAAEQRSLWLNQLRSSAYINIRE